MPQYGMVIDVDRCIGCYNCFLACRDEYSGTDRLPIAAAQGDGQKWINVREQEQGSFPKVRVSYVPLPCLHCEDAPCMAANDDAIYRRPDGIVVIDPEKAAGRQDLVDSCPYGVIYWNEATDLPQKCTLCAHLLDDGWKQPRCVEVCPTDAIIFADMTAPGNAISRAEAQPGLEEIHAQYNTKPRVRYRNLPKPFVAGEVALSDQPGVPAPDVRLALARGSDVRTGATDGFGDFEFQGLVAGAEYTLSVEQPGYRPLALPVSTLTGLNLGTLTLERIDGR
jgi:Fe-S-cluster-containing dehydrogenase component